MLFGQDRDRIRGFYCQTWADHRAGRPLEPLQRMVVAVIEQHPEYHGLLTDRERACHEEYRPEAGETNPFLHMGMHIAIHEQIGSDRPAGIAGLYERLLARFPNAHRLQHRMMECLSEMLWQAQRGDSAPDEQAYLACVRSIAEDGK